jgi:TRAP-type C4-dicarboxylate transport system substrate-binding protein
MLRIVAITAMLTGFIGANSMAQDRTWKIGTVVAPPSMLGILVDEMADTIGKATDGKVKAERFQQPNEQEIAQNILRGRYEMAYISATGIAPAIPVLGVLNVPYLWTSAAERDYVTDKHVLPIVADIFSSKGVELIRYGEAGWSSIFCKTACTTPDSIKGMKIRVSPTAGDKMMFERLGANGVTMTLADFYPALEQGVVNGGTLTFSFYLIGPAAKSAPHYVFTEHSHQPAFLIAHKQAWSGLPKDLQKAIADGIAPTFELRRRVAADEEPKMEQHKARGGFVHVLTAEQKKAWSDIIVPGHEQLVASYGSRAQELYQAIQNGKAEFAKQSGKK